jgi:hypothetical protein
MNKHDRREDAALRNGLPSSTEAERIILGCVLNRAADFDVIASTLMADDFSVRQNAAIFSLMDDMHAGKQHIDRLTVSEEARRRRLLTRIGGIGNLIELDHETPRLPDINSYIAIVKKRSAARRAVNELDQLAKRAIVQQEPSGLAGDVFRLYEDLRAADLPAWPDPLPLANPLPKVAPFDMNLLPDKFKPLVEDVTERMQVTPDFVAIPLIVAFAAAIGRRIRMVQKSHLYEIQGGGW